MKTEQLEYHVFCAPSTEFIEASVNKLLRERPGMTLEKTAFTTAPYYKRTAELKCPKCAADLVPNRQLNTGAKCLRCPMDFSQEFVQMNTQLQISPAGSLFIVEVILSKN